MACSPLRYVNPIDDFRLIYVHPDGTRWIWPMKEHPRIDRDFVPASFALGGGDR
jgi:hypothetical protein